MAANYQVRVRFLQQGLGVAMNVWTARNIAAIQPSDPTILADMEAWMEAIYAPLRPVMDTGCTFADADVVEVTFDEEGKVIVARVVGTIVPTISGLGTAEQLPLVDAGSAFARTGAPRVRGNKRFPGVSEVVQAEGLFNNVLLDALASAALAWLLGPTPGPFSSWLAGVMATSLLAFREFNGQAAVTNVPGTQVTRKPLRGL